MDSIVSLLQEEMYRNAEQGMELRTTADLIRQVTTDLIDSHPESAGHPRLVDRMEHMKRMDQEGEKHLLRATCIMQALDALGKADWSLTPDEEFMESSEKLAEIIETRVEQSKHRPDDPNLEEPPGQSPEPNL